MQENNPTSMESSDSCSNLSSGFNNKKIANRLLAAVFIIFLAAMVYRFLNKDSFFAGLLTFTAEAALVGGIADWFAVTALFTRPLGFSWHTAIIPRNREKIIEKITHMVEEELLGVESIKNKLASLNITGALLDKLSGVIGSTEFEEHLQNLMAENADRLDRTKITGDIDALIKENLKKENVAEEIKKLLVKAFEEQKHADWYSVLLDKALEIARKPSTREKIYKILKEQEKNTQNTAGGGTFFVKTLLNIAHSSKHVNLISISSLLQQELIEVLKQLKHPQNPVMGELTATSSDLVKKLDEAGTLSETIQNWKNGILDRLELLEALELMLSSIVESRINRAEAAAFIANHLDRYRSDLKNDDEMRIWIDSLLKDMLDKIIRSEHYLIGEIVKETLEAFTNERLNKFINEKVGDDLQWIRINGSIVGASAGALIYLFVNLVYSPYIVPMIRNLFGL